MKGGDPNLASSWSFLAGGRRHNFFPDLPDKYLPCLSASPGGQQLQKIVSAWGSALRCRAESA
jgi:hypothetical protein